MSNKSDDSPLQKIAAKVAYHLFVMAPKKTWQGVVLLRKLNLHWRDTVVRRNRLSGYNNTLKRLKTQLVDYATAPFENVPLADAIAELKQAITALQAEGQQILATLDALRQQREAILQDMLALETTLSERSQQSRGKADLEQTITTTQATITGLKARTTAYNNDISAHQPTLEAFIAQHHDIEQRIARLTQHLDAQIAEVRAAEKEFGKVFREYDRAVSQLSNDEDAQALVETHRANLREYNEFPVELPERTQYFDAMRYQVQSLKAVFIAADPDLSTLVAQPLEAEAHLSQVHRYLRTFTMLLPRMQ